MVLFFVTLLFFQSFSDWCESVTPANGKVLQAALNVDCPTCPYQKESDDLITEKKFNRNSADDVVKEIMNVVTEAISNSSNIRPDCPAPCIKNHKMLPIIKIEPQEISTKVVCKKKYIKTHTLLKTLSSSGDDDTCHKNVSDQASKWVENTLVSPSLPFFLGGGATEEGKELLKQCPDACSYYTTQVFDYTYKNNKKCDLKLTLIVDCGPAKLKAEFIGKGYIRDHLSCIK